VKVLRVKLGWVRDAVVSEGGPMGAEGREGVIVLDVFLVDGQTGGG
jgi:hypothetical protein